MNSRRKRTEILLTEEAGPPLPVPSNSSAVFSGAREILGIDANLASTARQLNKNLGHLLVGNTIALALNLVTTAYLARVLGQGGFGKLSLAQSVATYAALVLDLGLTTFGTRAIAKDQAGASELMCDILVVRLMAASGMLLVSLLILSHVPTWPDSELRTVVILSLFWVVPFAVAPEWFFLGLQRMSVVSVGKLLLFAGVFVFTLTTVHGPEGVAAAAVSRVAGGALWALWLLSRLPRGVLRPSRFRFGRAAGRVREAQWFWLLAIVAQVFAGVDVVILGIWRPIDEVGVYSASFRLVAFLLLGISLLNTAMFPMVASAIEKGRRPFVSVLKLYGIIALAIAFGLVAFGVPLAPLVVRLTYGETFGAAVPVLRILMLGGAVQTINGALAQPLLAADRESVVARQITGTAIVFLILNAIVIPKLGAMGAAWVYVGSVTVGTIWLVPGYRKLVNSHGTPPADADE